MPPKKEEKKAKPSSTKIVADKASICPYRPHWRHTDPHISDFWHEKRELKHQSPFPSLHAILVASNMLDSMILMEVDRRKKEHKPKSKYRQSKHRPPKPKPLIKNEKMPKKRNGKKIKRPQNKRSEKQQSYSSRYKCKKCLLGWILRRCCAHFTSKATVRKEKSANSAMICPWRGKGRRKICTKIRGKGRMRRRRKMTWRSGMKVSHKTRRPFNICSQESMLIAVLHVEKLRQVVMSKHGNPKTTTDKVCKFFISAVEEGKYGWFWTCPNGGDKCMYKHSLPPGFVLKTKEQRAAEKALMDKSPLKTLTLEDFLESERHKLTGTLTPVTPESFAKWKKERLDKKAAEDEARQAKEATGRAMFEKGGWEDSEEGDDSEEEDDAEDEADEWDMESMRRETERLREENEKKRLEDVGGQAAIESNGIEEEDGAVGVKEVVTNGVNGHLDDT